MWIVSRSGAHKYIHKRHRLVSNLFARMRSKTCNFHSIWFSYLRMTKWESKQNLDVIQWPLTKWSIFHLTFDADENSSFWFLWPDFCWQLHRNSQRSHSGGSQIGTFWPWLTVYWPKELNDPGRSILLVNRQSIMVKKSQFVSPLNVTVDCSCEAVSKNQVTKTKNWNSHQRQMSNGKLITSSTVTELHQGFVLILTSSCANKKIKLSGNCKSCSACAQTGWKPIDGAYVYTCVLHFEKQSTCEIKHCQQTINQSI